MAKSTSRSSLSSPRKGKSASRPPSPDKGSLESGVYHLASTGKLAGAARGAIRLQKRNGVSITFQQGNRILKQHADGRTEVLQTLPRGARYVPPKGVKVIEG